MNQYENPFVFGGDVTGKGYIGRKDLYNELMKEVFLTPDRSGSFALRGLTRMGKTSLLRKCMLKEKASKEVFVFPIWIKMSTIDNFKDFLFELIEKIKESYTSSDILSREVFEMLDTFEDESLPVSKLKRKLVKIFKALGATGAKTVVILDEFDSANTVFEQKANYFQIFRDLVSNEQYNASFLMTCRLPISAIETSLPQGSNLRGVINEKKIVGFNKYEIQEYFDLINKCGLELTDDQKNEILYYGGNSPFILSGLAKGLLSIDSSVPSNQVKISDIYADIKSDVFAYFHSLTDHMKHEHLYSKMLQIYLGPKTDLTDHDINNLLDYGYIYSDPLRAEQFIDPMTGAEYLYQTLSIHFVQYLRNTANTNDDISVWRELIKTEKKLRVLIRKCLTDEYLPKDWENELKAVARTREKGDLFNVRLSEKFITKSKEDFGDGAVKDILSVISIESLSRIIAAYWVEAFQEIFNPPYNKEGLEGDLSRLHRARNPLAHGTAECLSDEDRYEVNKFCREINNSIDRYMNINL